MSREDFCRCTPAEFRAVADAWHGVSERAERSAWERARMICLYNLMPYSTKPLRPMDVLVFSWEGNQNEGAPEHEVLSEEEKTMRFEEAKKRYGLSS